MTRKTITNDGANPMYVGGFCIPPGETRVFEEADLPPHLRGTSQPSAPTPAPPDPRLAILDFSVANFKRHLTETAADGAPVASDEDLAFFSAAEAEGKNRKGIHEAIDEETITRAANDEALTSLLELPLDEFIQAIAAKDDSDNPSVSAYQLDRLVEACAVDEAKAEHLEAVHVECKARALGLETGDEEDGDTA